MRSRSSVLIAFGFLSCWPIFEYFERQLWRIQVIGSRHTHWLPSDWKIVTARNFWNILLRKAPIGWKRNTKNDSLLIYFETLGYKSFKLQWHNKWMSPAQPKQNIYTRFLRVFVCTSSSKQNSKFMVTSNSN